MGVGWWLLSHDLEGVLCSVGQWQDVSLSLLEMQLWFSIFDFPETNCEDLRLSNSTFFFLPSLQRCHSLCCVISWCYSYIAVSACLLFWASAASFMQCIFAMHFGIACLGLCILEQCLWLLRSMIVQLHSGMACLACDWFIYDWCLSKYVHCKLCCGWLPF